jgi:hypothetical protein
MDGDRPNRGPAVAIGARGSRMVMGERSQHYDDILR